MLKTLKASLSILSKKCIYILSALLALGPLHFLTEIALGFSLHAFFVHIGNIPKVGGESFLVKLSMPAIMAILICVGISKALIGVLRGWLLVVLQQDFIFENRQKMFSKTFESQRSFSFSGQMNDSQEGIRNASLFLNFGLSFLIGATISLLLFAVCIRLLPFESFIALAAFFIFEIPLRALQKNRMSLGKAVSKSMRRISEGILRSMRNSFLIHIYRSKEMEIEKFRLDSLEYKALNAKHGLQNSIRANAPQFIGIIVGVGIAYISIVFFHSTASSLLPFFYILLRLTQVSSAGVGDYSQAKFYYPFFENFVNLALKEQSKKEKFQKRRSTETLSEELIAAPTITFKNLSFAYDGRESVNVFSNINLTLKAGGKLWVRGPSGSGKSTLVKLLCGYETPTQGEILINQKPLETYLHSMLLKTGYVGPEPYLVNGSIRENLLYGHPDESSLKESDFWESLKRVKLDDLFLKSKNGLEEMLSDHAEISTGQKQRLSLARAFLRKPVLLILDEATANLDYQTEAEIMQDIFNQLQQMTVFVISHRDSVKRWSDCVFDMENPTQLVSENTLYN